MIRNYFIAAAATLIMGAGSSLFAQDAAPQSTPEQPTGTAAPADQAPPADAAPASNKKQFRVALQPGAQFIIRRTMTQSIDQTINGGPWHTQSEQIQEYLFQVHSVDADGVMTIMGTHKRFKHFEQGPGGDETNWDSGTGEEAYKQPVTILLQSMLNKSFWFQLGANGKVVAVKGASEMAMDSLGNADVFKDPMTEQLKQNLFNSFNDDGTAKALNGIFANIPTEPVAPGDSWTTKGGEMQLNLPVISESNFVLSSSDPNITVIQVNAHMIPDPAAPPQVDPETIVAAGVNGTRKATYEINSTYGVLQKGSVQMLLEGHLMTPMGLIPSRFDINVLFELVPVT